MIFTKPDQTDLINIMPPEISENLKPPEPSIQSALQPTNLPTAYRASAVHPSFIADADALHQEAYEKKIQLAIEDTERQSYRYVDPKPPQTVSLNGVLYEYIPDTQRFFIRNPADDTIYTPSNLPDETFTILDLITHHSPSALSKRAQITIPPIVYQLNNAGRARIIRAVQYNTDPPIPDDTTGDIITLFELARNSEAPSLIKPRSEYSYSLWACDYDSTIATQLICEWGWVPEYRVPNTHNLIYSLEKTPNGVQLDICYDHFFADRFAAGCSAMEFVWNTSLSTLGMPDFAACRSEAFRTFYLYKDTFCSLTTETRKIVETLFNKKLESLRAGLQFTDTFDEPEDIYPDQSVFISWDKFICTKNYSSVYKKLGAYLREDRRMADTFYTKLAALPVGVPLKRSAFKPYLYNNSFDAALKHGFLRKVKYGYYEIVPQP